MHQASLKTYMLVVVLVSISASNGFARERKNFLRDLLANDEYECSWSGSPSVGSINNKQVCVGNGVCKHVPKSKPPVTKEDVPFTLGCLANNDGTCTDVRNCEFRNDTTNTEVKTRAGYLTNDSRKKETHPTLGECEYDTVQGFSRGILVEEGEGLSLLCATPMKCSRQPQMPVAVCDVDDFKIIEEKNPYTGTMEKAYYPVCSPPVSCLAKGAKEGFKFNFATVSKQAASNSSTSAHPPHARIRLIEQIVSTAPGSQRPAGRSLSPHM